MRVETPDRQVVVDRRSRRGPLVFAAVGVVNTAVDVGLFLLLRVPLGIVAATIVSTAAGMLVSFTLNGRYTFGAERVTTRQGVLFVLTNVVVLWGVQPPVILAVVHLLGGADDGGTGTLVALVGKGAATAVSMVLSWLSYRHLVWPEPRVPLG